MDHRRRRKSRFSRDPGLSNDGTPKIIPPYRLTTQDVHLLKLLARRRFLSAEYIAVLIGTSYKYAQRRLRILNSKPNCYIKIADFQLEHPNLYLTTPLFYELDRRGLAELIERGVRVPPRKPIHHRAEHQIMVDQIMASFEMGGINGNFICRADIIQSPNTPQATRALPVPERIPLPDSRILRPDGEMFVLQTFKGFMFFPGIEADAGTEPINSVDLQRASIIQKFRDYIAVIQNKIYHSHFGARTFFIPFITTSELRLSSMMNLFTEMTNSNNVLRTSFLFKTHPIFTSYKKPQATGHMITEPWARIGENGKAEVFILGEATKGSSSSAV